MATHDAHKAHMQHEDMQETSCHKRCNSGELLEELVNFHLEDHNGTRMLFLKEWHDKHHRLKEPGGKTCNLNLFTATSRAVPTVGDSRVVQIGHKNNFSFPGTLSTAIFYTQMFMCFLQCL